MQLWCLARVGGFDQCASPNRSAGHKAPTHLLLPWSPQCAVLVFTISALLRSARGNWGSHSAAVSLQPGQNSTHSGPPRNTNWPVCLGFAMNVRMFHKTKCFPNEGCNDHSLIWLSESLKKNGNRFSKGGSEPREQETWDNPETIYQPDLRFHVACSCFINCADYMPNPVKCSSHSRLE